MKSKKTKVEKKPAKTTTAKKNLTPEEKDKICAAIKTVEQYQSIKGNYRRRTYKFADSVLLKAIIAVEKSESLVRKAKKKLEHVLKREEKLAKKAVKKTPAEKPAPKDKKEKKAAKVKAKVEKTAAAVKDFPDTDKPE